MTEAPVNDNLDVTLPTDVPGLQQRLRDTLSALDNLHAIGEQNQRLLTVLPQLVASHRKFVERFESLGAQFPDLVNDEIEQWGTAAQWVAEQALVYEDLPTPEDGHFSAGHAALLARKLLDRHGYKPAEIALVPKAVENPAGTRWGLIADYGFTQTTLGHFTELTHAKAVTWALVAALDCETDLSELPDEETDQQ